MNKKNRLFPAIRITREAKDHLEYVTDALNKSGQSTSMTSLASSAVLSIPLPSHNGHDTTQEQ